MGGLAWVGLWLTLNQTGFTPKEFVWKPAVSAEATALVTAGKLVTFTVIAGKPLHGPERKPYLILNVDIGWKVF